MPKENSEQVNRVQTPIDLAMKMFTAQQDRLMNTIVGPERQVRQQKVGGVPLDNIMPQVLADMERM